MTTDSDIEQCRVLLRGGSRSFHAASLLLPRSVREPATALYAFCRLADDAIDGGSDPVRALAEWRTRLDRIYRGHPLDVPADRAFAAVAERFAVPRALPEALLEGFEWDAQNRRYETLDDLCEYAVRVAGTVGAMMTLLMERRDPAVLTRAVELGVAMQLTNIARDVGEDARAGRLYLPQRWLRGAGIDPGRFMAAPAFDPALASVVGRLLAAADLLYGRAASGIARLPASCRFGVHAAGRLYAEIGREVARNGLDSVARRAVVPPSRKLVVLASAAAAAVAPAMPPEAPPLPEARFLIDAAAASLPERPADAGAAAPPWWRLGARAVWVIELFARLERREQLKRAGPGF